MVDHDLMIPSTGFVGATIDMLLDYESTTTSGSDIALAAEEFLAALSPIGDPFEMPWKLVESLYVLQPCMPEPLSSRLMNPGSTPAANHLEASVRALALEAGACLEPLTKQEMLRIQHGARRATEDERWGRQSPHPWDTVAEAELDECRFFALCVPA